MPPDIQARLKSFGYHKSFGSIAASTSVPAVFNVQTGWNFRLRRIGVLVFQDAAFVAQSAPPLLIQIMDSGQGENLFDDPVPLHSVATTTGLASAVDLAEPRDFRGGTNITVTVTNLDSGHAYVVRLALLGVHTRAS
jgi:hypothetical protein